jgi:hypothetical protein
MDEEDLEAERLFDYGILAPIPWTDIGEIVKELFSSSFQIFRFCFLA